MSSLSLFLPQPLLTAWTHPEMRCPEAKGEPPFSPIECTHQLKAAGFHSRFPIALDNGPWSTKRQSCRQLLSGEKKTVDLVPRLRLCHTCRPLECHWAEGATNTPGSFFSTHRLVSSRTHFTHAQWLHGNIQRLSLKIDMGTRRTTTNTSALNQITVATVALMDFVTY